MAESLKSVGEICEPDPRWRAFALELDEMHRGIDAVKLNSAIPEAIRDQFTTAKNV